MATITIETGPIHIGEKERSKWPPKVGATWECIFYLQDVPQTSKLSAEVWETEREHNEVFVNDAWMGHLALNTGSQYVASSMTVPVGALRKGANQLFIKAAQWGTEHEPHFDNFLIRNIQLTW